MGFYRFRLSVLLLLGVLFLVGRPAAAELLLAPHGAEVSLAGHWSALRDPAGNLDIDQVQGGEGEALFRPLPGELAAGFDSAAWWLRAELRRQPGAPAHWLLEVEPAFLDRINLFVVDGRGRMKAVETGDNLPFSSREVAHRTFVFRLDLDEDHPTRLYLRVKSTSTVTLTARLLSEPRFMAEAASRGLVQGAAHGALLVTILFALVQFMVGRDRLYLGFLAYAVPLEVMYLCNGGVAAQYLFPDHPLVADRLQGICICLAVGGVILFTARLLELASHLPWLDRICRGLGRACQLAAVSPLLGVYGQVAPLVQGTLLLVVLTGMGLAAWRAWRGDRLALWYLVAFAGPVGINVLVVTRVLGLLHSPLSLVQAAHVVAGIHLLLVTVGLMWRGAGIEAVRQRIRQQQLDSAHQIERALEERVRQRTQELGLSNEYLAREIAERRAAEERVREREAQLRAILDAAPFPMLAAGFPAGQVHYLNGPAAELLNLSPEAVVGLSVADLWLDPGESGPLMEKVGLDGAMLGAEFRIRRFPREQRWVLLSAVRFSHGGQDSVLVCLNDISARKQLEEMQRLTSRRAEAALEAERQAAREQRNFLAMVSHEFRVPLAIIAAASQLLGIYLRDNAEGGEEVAKIRRAVRRMTELMDVCLADDRLDSSALHLRLDALDVGRMLAEICDDIRPLVGGRPLRLEGGSTTKVVGDPTLLRIAFANLIDNAIKFSPPDSPVTISVEECGDAVRVRVADQGPGIAIEEQERIFEKFYRSTKSDRVRGAGLGLFIVRRILELHGTAIAVDSRLGEGAVFEVWLPAGLGNVTDRIDT